MGKHAKLLPFKISHDLKLKVVLKHFLTTWIIKMNKYFSENIQSNENTYSLLTPSQAMRDKFLYSDIIKNQE